MFPQFQQSLQPEFEKQKQQIVIKPTTNNEKEIANITAISNGAIEIN